MQVMMLTRYSPEKGKRLAAGQVVDVPDYVGEDLVARGVAVIVETTQRIEDGE